MWDRVNLLKDLHDPGKIQIRRQACGKRLQGLWEFLGSRNLI
jgi:hypothetical protein